MKHRPIVVVPALPAHLVARREFLRRTALGLAALPLVSACASDTTRADSGFTDASAARDAAAADAAAADAAGRDAATEADAGTELDAGQVDAGSAASWATGGTAAMIAKATYPQPFTEPLSACALVATTTEGPCTTSDDQVREDVSEGWAGLPVRLALKVVDTSCSPLAGVSVKIWHTNLSGSYSGETPNNTMCLKDQAYASSDFFRGVQTTAADGSVYFDTCFPGWYRGRAVHIHFQVKSGNTSYRVSQLFFPEDVTAEVFASHPEYSGFGQPDTTFSNDNIIGGIASADRARHIFAVTRTSDGAMLASKVVTVR